MNLLFALVIAALFGSGVHLMSRRDLVRLAVGTLLVGNAAILFLVASGLGGREVPLLPAESSASLADPLVQALALTAVVIAFATTVLLLRVALAVVGTHDSLDMEDIANAELDDEADDSNSSTESEEESF